MIMQNLETLPAFVQVPLIQVVNEDDELLANSPDALWYQILKDFVWPNYRSIGAAYYNVLYHFNSLRKKPSNNGVNGDETKQQAAQRLLFDRATMDETAPILFEGQSTPDVEPTILPSSIAPGITPRRLGGKKPKCFFALIKSFIGAPLMGFAAVPEKVRLLLTSNLAFARVCGFIPKSTDEQYWYKYVPSLRKLEQFDQIMTEYGLWDQCKRQEVLENIDQGIIQKENVLVGDTSHYHAYSGFETLTYIDKKGKEIYSQIGATLNSKTILEINPAVFEWIQLFDNNIWFIIKL